MYTGKYTLYTCEHTVYTCKHTHWTKIIDKALCGIDFHNWCKLGNGWASSILPQNPCLVSRR